jgi:N-acetyltransferase
MSRLDVPTLTGRLVSLEPMQAAHAEAIAAAAAGDRSTFGYTQVPDGLDESVAYVSWLLDEAAHGRAAPLVQRRVADAAIVGCTRFMSPLWQLGRSAPDEIEIGGTWLSASAQRTGINAEAKLLLLTHAFDVWGVQRVAICTDARNTRSREAIERLGATFEGVLRRHRRSTRAADGDRLRDTASYSITVDDWPDVGERLRSRSVRHVT